MDIFKFILNDQNCSYQCEVEASSEKEARNMAEHYLVFGPETSGQGIISITKINNENTYS